MSLRYTGEATMDEPALRDVERWKDKIEVRLDNRQVFFLFFGSAMVACMLFVLGVIVGKRLESRGRAEAPAVEDPLAVLDRFGAVATATAPPPTLTFPRALIGGGASKNRPSSLDRLERTEKVVEHAERAPAEKAGVEHAGAERIAARPTLTAVAPAAAIPIATALKPVAGMPVRTVGTGAAGKPSASAQATGATSAPVRKVAVAALPRPSAAGSAAGPVAGKAAGAGVAKEPNQVAKVAGGGASKARLGAGVPSEKTKGRFLLQLSSFQDRADADAFAHRFASQNAYVVATEIPGKGTWYRVRVGSYGSMQEASVAKTNFERDHNVIAYVAGSGPVK